jgi:hypothetical protein
MRERGAKSDDQLFEVEVDASCEEGGSECEGNDLKFESEVREGILVQY